ncbi:hypothetical protein [Alkaliphilus metalliredigens]|nr:hypothetical protein [Alkaliphilus metalliredigens]
MSAEQAHREGQIIVAGVAAIITGGKVWHGLVAGGAADLMTR